MITMLKRKVNVLAKEELFRNKFNRWFAGVVGVYPVKRGSTDTGAVKTALKLMFKCSLSHQYLILINYSDFANAIKFEPLGSTTFTAIKSPFFILS